MLQIKDVRPLEHYSIP